MTGTITSYNKPNVKAITSKGRPDSGWSWVIAASCFFINMMMYGVCRLAGQLFVETKKIYPVTRREASFPYSLTSAVRNLAGPLIGYLGHLFGVRIVAAAGGLFSFAGIAICFAATDVTWLVIFWGVIFGIGFGLGNVLLPVSLNQHFVRHRATASGIALSGASAGSFILPSIVDMAVSEYGLHGAFLILGGLMFNCVPAAMLLRDPEYDVADFILARDITRRIRSASVKIIEKIRSASEIIIGKVQTAQENINVKIETISEDTNELVQSAPTKSDTNTNENLCLDMNQEEHDSHVKQNGIDGKYRNKSCSFHYPVTINSLDATTEEEKSKEQQITIPDVKISSTDHENTSNDTFKKALKLALNPIFLLITFCVAMYGYTFMLSVTVFIDFALDIGIEHSMAKYVLMCYSVGDFIGRVGLGWTTDAGYMSVSTFSAMCFLFQGIAAICVVCTSTFWGLLANVFVFGIFNAGWIVITSLVIAHYIDNDLQTVAIPSSNILYGPVCLAVSPTIGYFRETVGSYAGVFYTVGGISILCGLMWLYVSFREFCEKRRKS